MRLNPRLYSKQNYSVMVSHPTPTAMMMASRPIAGLGLTVVGHGCLPNQAGRVLLRGLDHRVLGHLLRLRVRRSLRGRFRDFAGESNKLTRLFKLLVLGT